MHNNNIYLLTIKNCQVSVIIKSKGIKNNNKNDIVKITSPITESIN